MSDYYSFSTEYGAADKFFQAVLSLDKQRVERLKAQGVSLTENVKQTLINGGGSMVSNKPAAPFWYLYLTDLEGISKEGFVYISHTFFEETGAQLYYSESLVNAIGKYFYNSAVFNCLMECYNLKKLNKKKTMQEIIRKSRVDLLKICVNAGWLSQAKKRDELIEYAQMNNQVECTAWLMDFKNRTADFAAEREKAEKKMMRELNADPNSVGELKKIWTYKKQDDGTLIITSYKGSTTVVTIPEIIGKDTVTAIGEYALAGGSPKATEQHRQIRKKITKITVPDTVNRIESNAFDRCLALREVNLPNGITEIASNTFSTCRSLETVKIPDSVTKIDKLAFKLCDNLKSVIIPSSVTIIENDTDSKGKTTWTVFQCSRNVTAIVEPKSYAERYCKRNGIPYKYAE